MANFETFLKEKYNIDDKNIAKIQAKIKIRDIELIKSKIDYFKTTLSFSNQEIAEVIVAFPKILTLDTKSDKPDGVKEKIKFYKDALKLTDKELHDFIKSLPNALGYDTVTDKPKSVKSKLKFYKENLGMSDEQLIKFIKNSPYVLSYDTISKKPTSVKSKLEILHKIGISNDQIIVLPKMLAYPAQSLKMRLMLKAIYYGTTESFDYGMMFNEQLVYARAKFVKSRNDIPSKLIYQNDKRFSQRTNTTSEELLKQYVLTQEIALQIQNEFNKDAKEKLILTETELSQYPKEVEVEVE